MKNFRFLAVAVVLLLTLGGVSQAQVAIPGTKVQYKFPSKWNYLNTQQLDDNTTQYLYYYSAETLLSEGDTTVPLLRIVVSKNYTKSLYEYVFERYSLQPYQSLSDYTEGLGLPSKGGMGYIGAYTNLKDKKDYQFRMVYFQTKNAIVEFRLETTRDTYPQMEQEFNAILKSLKF